MQRNKRKKQAIKTSDKNKTRKTGCNKRIFTTKWYDVSDAEDIEATVEKAVRLAVEDILEMEKQVFAQLGNK